MSIETLLTIAVAVGLLVMAVALRFITIGLFRLGSFLWASRTGPSARQARLDDALPAVSLRERVSEALDGAGALLIYVVANIARALRPVGEWIRVALRAVWYALVSAYAWVAPRADAAFKNLSFVSEAPVPVLVHRSVATGPGTARKIAAAKSNMGGHAGAA